MEQVVSFGQNPLIPLQPTVRDLADNLGQRTVLSRGDVTKVQLVDQPPRNDFRNLCNPQAVRAFQLEHNACPTSSKTIELGTEEIKIASPNFPAKYLSYANCRWQFQAPSGSHVRVKFYFFETEPDLDELFISTGNIFKKRDKFSEFGRNFFWQFLAKPSWMPLCIIQSSYGATFSSFTSQNDFKAQLDPLNLKLT